MMEHPVRVRETPHRTALALRQKVAPEHLGEAIGTALSCLYSETGRHGLGSAEPPEVCYLGRFPAREVDLEIRVPVSGLGATGYSGGAQVLELPATTCASTVHEGDYGRLGEAYRALERWMTEHGYRAGGPPIEFYLAERTEGAPPSTYRIEVAIPIAR